jgi:hypothetical protein
MIHAPSVRAELVEALSFFFSVPKTVRPFDRLRANGSVYA